MLDRLKPRPGSVRGRKRLGRGPGSGRGRTSTHGEKGQGKRGSGLAVSRTFEGGQMPLHMRLPKRGFVNRFRRVVEIVNLEDLVKFGDGARIDAESLARSGLIRGSGATVKLLGNGEAPRNLQVRVDRISASAKQKVEAAGGTVELAT